MKTMMMALIWRDEVDGGEGKRTNVDASPCESPANRLSTRTSLLESKEGD